MIYDYCSLTGLPLRDGDDVVVFQATSHGVSVPWDGATPAQFLASSHWRGTYLQGWLVGHSRPSLEAILTAVFLLGTAWDRFSKQRDGFDGLDEVIRFATSSGVLLSSVLDLKAYQNRFSRQAFLTRLDFLDEMIRNRP